ncbi:unnamed protein product [Microthlaspi erraticum]|uniref:Replication protein A 70 kDa DNA-binding subunit B/D first OB fold domain-containing protein n=1 Tax=Microthlaspi erraticum TaxID=1685480 RepID=A0A6D2J932_9BRAS|nr:unnamed protein product [Microthlaspi erraticum]
MLFVSDRYGLHSERPQGLRPCFLPRPAADDRVDLRVWVLTSSSNFASSLPFLCFCHHTTAFSRRLRPSPAGHESFRLINGPHFNLSNYSAIRPQLRRYTITVFSIKNQFYSYIARLPCPSRFRSLTYPLDQQNVKHHRSAAENVGSEKLQKDGELMSLDMLFVDHENTMIQGSIHHRRIPQFRASLEEGRIYTIHNFDVVPAYHRFKITTNTKSIRFTYTTTLQTDEKNASLNY